MTPTQRRSAPSVWLATIALALVPTLACSDAGGGSACPETAKQAEALQAQCVGSAKSCSSIGIYTSSGKEACAYPDGCDLSYDYQDCRGSATRCEELSEVYCGHQIGCTWQATAGGSSGAGSGSGGSPGAPTGGATTEPCLQASGGAPSGVGAGGAGGGAVTAPGTGGSGGGVTPDAGSTSAGGSGGGVTLPDAGSTSDGGSGGGVTLPDAG